MRLHRSAVLFWALAGSVALITGLTVSTLVGRAAARAAALGGLRPVPVATRQVPAGGVVGPADVALRRLPAALVPAAPAAPDPAGRVALVDLVPGEVVLAGRLAPEGVEGVAALLPAGMRAVAIPLDTARLPLRPGHRVDVLATFDTADPGAEPTVVVATAALVLHLSDQAATLAVTPAESPRLAFALARGLVTLALTSSEPRSEDARFPGPGPASSGGGR